MMNNVALNVVCGLAFIYLFYGVIAMLLHEVFSRYFSVKANFLQATIHQMLDGNDDRKQKKGRVKLSYLFPRPVQPGNRSKLTTHFYEHPLVVKAARTGRNGTPKYLQNGVFSEVVVDMLKGNFNDMNVARGVNQAIVGGYVCERNDHLANISEKNLAAIAVFDRYGYELYEERKVYMSEQTHRLLEDMWLESGASVPRFRVRLDDWFNESVSATTSHYRKYTGLSLFLVGFVLSVAFNVNTIDIIAHLSELPATTLPKNSLSELSQLYSEAHSLDIADVGQLLSIGWHQQANKDHFLYGFMCFQCNNLSFVASLFGWVFSAIAIAIFAPLWFQLFRPLIKYKLVQKIIRYLLPFSDIDFPAGSNKHIVFHPKERSETDTSVSSFRLTRSG